MGVIAAGTLLIIYLARWTSALSDTVIFGISALLLVALAWALGEATDQLGRTLGPRISGILNATFGNLPELVIVLLLVRSATDTPSNLAIAQASIIGSVLGNMLLVLGASFFAGGMKNGVQVFGKEFARAQTSMLTVAVIAISFPTALFLLDGEAKRHIEGLSVATSVVMLVAYVVSTAWFLSRTASVVDKAPARWTAKTSLVTLAISAAGVGIMSELLVGSIEHTVEDIGISPVFLGMILVPIIGNIAEHFVAVQIAWRNDIDFAMTVALGSSVQVAMALAPIAVLMSPLFGPQLTLAFEPIAIAAMFLSVSLVTLLTSDSESTWLDGVLLLTVYAILGIAFWYPS